MDYLHGDELEYELAIRGYPVEGTVADKRKRLRPALRMEKEGVAFTYHSVLTFDEEIETCSGKIDELKVAIDSFNYANASNEVKRYRARLRHVMGRLNRIENPQGNTRKGELLVKCGEISDFLEESALLLDPVRVPESPSIVPDLGLSSSGPTAGLNVGNQNASFRQANSEQSRNVSLIDIDPQDLGAAIGNLHLHSPTEITVTAGTQTITTTSASCIGPSTVMPSFVFPHPTYMSATASGPGNVQGPYSAARPQFPTYWQPQSQRELQPASTFNPSGGTVPSETVGPSRRVNFPDFQNHRCYSGGHDYGSDMESHDRLRIFKTVSQWSLKFDGLTGVNNFLESVEELRAACGISKYQLIGVAIVLFKGVALDWFRANINQSHSWDNLVQMLRSAFLPGEYEEDLWADIRTRTQGQQEHITTYISVMQNLFNKLSDRPSDQTRLRIIRRNLLPHIQNRLALADFSTIAELTMAGQRVEETQARVDRFKPPPTNPLMVSERELMYNPRRYRQQVTTIDASTESGQTTSTRQVDDVGSRAIKCWNCQQSGHQKRDCTRPRTKHCFGCGHPNVIKSACPTCSGNRAVAR